jgi:hypothetical protein
MASAKSRRYGMGGMKHKKVTQAGRPNGKAWKKLSVGFWLAKGRLAATSLEFKGKSF